MTFSRDEPKTFHRFLDKFNILDQIPWNEKTIELSIMDICRDLTREQIDYCWLDFSINKYMGIGWHKSEAISFIYDCFERYSPGKVGLILSLKYESLRQNQRQHAAVIENSDIADKLIGIDLVGDEAYFDSAFYADLFKPWKSLGRMVRAHVGESQSHQNIRKAIEDLKVTNVAHGFKCLADPELILMARDARVQFDLAITSNYITGSLDPDQTHPVIKMMDLGLDVTLGSDDPTQLGTDLQQEYQIFANLATKLGRPREEYVNRLTTTATDSTKRYFK